MSGALRYRIRHETVYEYGGDVVHAHELLHLAPRAFAHQSVVDHSIDVRPEPSSRGDEVDAFGNAVTRLEFERPHRRLEVVAATEVEVCPRPAACAEDSEPWERVREALSYHSAPPAPDRLEAGRFRLQSPFVRVKAAFADYAKDCFPAGRPILEASEALMRRIRADFQYAPGETAVGTPLLRVLAERRGVCQDFSHVMIACMRSLGLASRYVSGYVKTSALGAAARGSDASHAWVSVHCPPLGWIDLDPTNGIRVDTEHVTIAWGRDFGDVSPLRGVITGGGAHTVSVKVSTTPASR
jgi:transglutaminase-like putative cysteine protease